jgi:hypothetical protein
MPDLTATLDTAREQYAYALSQYRAAEPKSKLQLTRWEILRWAVDALNRVLAHFKEPLVEMEPTPWSLTAEQVFEAACERQRAGLCHLCKSKRKSYANAA